MRWEHKKPAYGDMIRVALGGIYHFGIYVSEKEVIQFGLPPSARARLQDSEITVLAADLTAFLAGGKPEVALFDEGEPRRSAAETVSYARAKIGMKGYHILYNNCEHFANECISGKQICRQAEDVRAYFRNLPLVDVYFAKMPDVAPTVPIICAERRAEIEETANERVRLEKHYVWQLLCYGLERSLGLRAEGLTFAKQPYGGWTVNGAEFSLSHSEGALAVAVSRTPVGIDIERVRTHSDEALAARIFTENEQTEWKGLPAAEKTAYLISCFTGKEAVFKQAKGGLRLSEIDTTTASLKQGSLTVEDRTYAWSVATATPHAVRVFKDIKLA
ncbi:MAG: lecithin retinol acyltransferase family protein [Clostridia bacterium]|nr:lecithin retinol acyltransferase family protein [Clostridia bacterium]